MANLNPPKLSPGSVLEGNEVAISTGLSAARVHSLVRDKILPRSACAKKDGRPGFRAFAVPMVSFAASDGAKLSERARREAMRMIETFAKENWPRLRKNPDCAKKLRYETGIVTVALGKSVSEAMAGLNRWQEARSRVVRDPDMRGGIPTMRGTRIGVYEAASIFAGYKLEEALEEYPSMTREAFEAAALYVKVYPPLKRGRPWISRKGWRLVSRRIVPLPEAASGKVQISLYNFP